MMHAKNSTPRQVMDSDAPRMSLALRPAAVGAEAKYLAERLRAFRVRVQELTTDEESWRLLRAADALDQLSATLAPEGRQQ